MDLIQKIKYSVLYQQTIPEVLFSLRQSSFKNVFAYWYSKYLWIRYKNDYYYWFNQLFNNEFLFKENSYNIPMNYSKFIFALFISISYFLLYRIFDKYGERMFSEIDIHAPSDRVEQYIVYLHCFGVYLDYHHLINLLNYLDNLTRNMSSWKRERFKTYTKSVFNEIEYYLIDPYLKNKIRSQILLFLM